MNDSTGPHTAPRVLIAAFQGWSDAGDATTEALKHLIGLQQSELLHEISGEGFVDLQLQRPKMYRDEHGKRAIEWPDTKLYGTVHRPGETATDEAASEKPDAVTRIDGTPVHDLFFLSGYEPGRDWENFTDEVVELCEVWGIDLVVLLGSMYSDAPHSRPIISTVSSENPEIRNEYSAERSDYEGAVGIVTALEIALDTATIGTLALWVQVPHYVHSAPSPKATLTILDKLEELLDVVIPRGELFEQATSWESNINRIAENDDDMKRYIKTLEEARDEALAAETTGDQLAAEFEKFLNPAPEIVVDQAQGADGAEPREAGATGTETSDSADPDPDLDPEQKPETDGA